MIVEAETHFVLTLRFALREFQQLNTGFVMRRLDDGFFFDDAAAPVQVERLYLRRACGCLSRCFVHRSFHLLFDAWANEMPSHNSRLAGRGLRRRAQCVPVSSSQSS